MNSTISGNATAGDVSVSFTVSGSGDGQIGVTPILPAGNSGTLGTRSENDNGIVTLSAGHTITTGTVDVFWTGGYRYGMDAVVDGNDVTIDSGSGDNLPAEGATVIVSQQVSVDFAVDGDNIDLIFAHSPARASLDFQDSVGTSLSAVELTANQLWYYKADSGYANPLTGNAVATVKASNGTTTAATLSLAATYDSTV